MERTPLTAETVAATGACRTASTRHTALARLLPVLALTLLLASCRRESEYFGKTDPPEENVFRFNNGAEPEYLDPGMMTANTDERIAAMLFEGLTQKDPRTLQPMPGIAERGEIAPDGLTYTFFLRRGAQWSDGHTVTAHDFVCAWTRVLDPKTASAFASILYPILNAEQFNQGKLKDRSQVGVEALDNYTLRVRLQDPVPYFLYLTTFFTLYPVPSWIVEKHGADWTRPEHVVGNGAFRLIEHRINDRIVLERNPRYYNAAQVRLDRVIAYAVVDLYTAINLYESGEVDWMPSNSVPSDFVPHMQGRFRDYSSTPQLASYYFTINTTHPPFDNRLVRRALALAVDRRAITDEMLRGGGADTRFTFCARRLTRLSIAARPRLQPARGRPPARRGWLSRRERLSGDGAFLQYSGDPQAHRRGHAADVGEESGHSYPAAQRRVGVLHQDAAEQRA